MINSSTKNRTIYKSDYKLTSKYNTYKYPGLPPGPINNPSIGSIRAALDPMETKDIYYITGNHEIYSGVDRAFDALKKTSIIALDDKIVEIDGLQLIGSSFPEFNEEKNFKEILKSDENFSLEKPAILLAHSPSDVFAQQDGNVSHNNIYWMPNVDFSQAQELGIDLQLSGHAHKGQIFPFNFVTKLIFKGYDYGLHRIGDFQIYISSGTGVWGPTIRTGSWSEIVAIELK